MFLAATDRRSGVNVYPIFSKTLSPIFAEPSSVLIQQFLQSYRLSEPAAATFTTQRRQGNWFQQVMQTKCITVFILHIKRHEPNNNPSTRVASR